MIKLKLLLKNDFKKPKNCLNGTARGGSSIVILNAIQVIKGSVLYNTGYRVKNFFQNKLNGNYIVEDNPINFGMI